MSYGIVRGMFVSALVLGLVACGDDGDDHPTAPGPNYEGAWDGTTSQELPMSIFVSGNRVSSITFAFATDDCLIKVTGSPSGFSITGTSFSGTSSSQNVNFTVSGTFHTEASASGTFSWTQMFPECSPASGSVSWTAQRR